MALHKERCNTMPTCTRAFQNHAHPRGRENEVCAKMVYAGVCVAKGGGLGASDCALI